MRILNVNNSSKPGLSLSQMRARISIATPTPKTLLRCHKVVIITSYNSMFNERDRPNLLPIIGDLSQIDGYYDMNSICMKSLTIIQLLQFMRICKDHYQLSDYNALQLLAFFKHNLSEACRHLYTDSSRSKMMLDIDAPWRVQAKSIRELPGLEQLKTNVFYKNFRRIYSMYSNVMINVLPKKSMAVQFAGRHVRIQRTYHNESILWVGCGLSDGDLPFEVVSLLLKRPEENELLPCTNLINRLELYMGPLILASKSWPKIEQMLQHHYATLHLLTKANPLCITKRKQTASEIVMDGIKTVTSNYFTHQS